MKKIISILLIFTLIFSIFTTAYAESQKCSCDMTPVVFVPGFGEPIYLNPYSEDSVSVFPPENEVMDEALPDLLKAVFFGLLTGNSEAFGTYAIKAAETMLSPAACDKEGNAPENTGVEYELPTVDTHRNTAFVSDDSDDNGYFMFIYDWRLDPVENAKILKEYIDAVKELTGHDEIILSAHSQGNTVVASYLHLYGSADIEKLVFLSPAYQGLSLIGSIFAQDVSVIGKGNALADYLSGVMGYENSTGQSISILIKALNSIKLVDGLLCYIQKVLDDQLDRVFDECLTDIMGTLPGVWAFVPDEYYETAKEKVFKGSEEYAVITEKIDYYHYNVQKKIETILLEAKSSGTDIVIAAGYNISSIPVSAKGEAHSDFLIDTEYMSLGAFIAPYGKTFGESYSQKNSGCGHNHVSSDRIIDASTCLFPEYTWFIKNNGHNSFGTDYCAFIEWAVRYDGQPTVNTDEKYPQFMEISEGKLAAVVSDNKKDSGYEMIFAPFLSIFKKS